MDKRASKCTLSGARKPTVFPRTTQGVVRALSADTTYLETAVAATAVSGCGPAAALLPTLHWAHGCFFLKKPFFPLMLDIEAREYEYRVSRPVCSMAYVHDGKLINNRASK